MHETKTAYYQKRNIDRAKKVFGNQKHDRENEKKNQ